MQRLAGVPAITCLMRAGPISLKTLALSSNRLSSCSQWRVACCEYGASMHHSTEAAPSAAGRGLSGLMQQAASHLHDHLVLIALRQQLCLRLDSLLHVCDIGGALVSLAAAWCTSAPSARFGGMPHLAARPGTPPLPSVTAAADPPCLYLLYYLLSLLLD